MLKRKIQADPVGTHRPRTRFLRLWRRHWVVAPPLVGMATFLAQLVIYTFGRTASDAVQAALDQSVLNFLIGVGTSVYLRLRYPE